MTPYSRLLLTFSLVLISGLSVHAGPPPQSKAEVSYAADSVDGTKWAHQVEVLAFPEIARATHARLGGGWTRLTLRESAPVPGKLQALHAVIGFDRRFAPGWDMRLEVRPGLYGDLSDVHGGTWNAPVVGGLSYFASPKLMWLGGFMVDPRGSRFFPFIGFRWTFAESWSLEMVAPRPGIRYRVNDRVSLRAGIDFRGGSYRMARDYGTRAGDPRLNNDILEVREFRAGPGIEWTLAPSLVLDLSGGWAFERRYHYQRTNIQYYGKEAPYALATLRYRWLR